MPELFHEALSALADSLPIAQCFILPSTQKLPATLAIALSLALARDGFQRRVELHRTNGFTDGTRVAVLPDNLVFEFAGFLDTSQFDKGSAPSQPLLRLRQIEDPRGTIVTLPENEIVRLQHAGEGGRRATRGVRPSPVVPTVLDRIIGTTSYGNRDFFETDVILVMSPGRFESLLAEMVVSRPRGGTDLTSPAGALLPWGRVHEGGVISFSSASEAQGRPLLAVCSRLAPIITYLENEPDVRPKIIIDGIARINSDLTTFDRIIRRTDTLILAGFDEVAELRKIAAQGNVRAVQIRPEALEPPDGAALGNAFEAERRAALNARTFESIETWSVADPYLDRVSADLDAVASQMDREDRSVFQDELLNKLFSLLVRVSGDLSTHVNDDLCSRAELVNGDMASVHRHWHSEAAARMLSAARELTGRCISQLCANPAKREALEKILGREITQEDISILSESRHLEEIVDGAPVIVLAGWPGKQRLNEIVFRFRTARVIAVCYGFEAKWFRSFNSRYRSIEMYVAPGDLPYRPSENELPKVDSVRTNDRDEAIENDPSLEDLLDRQRGRGVRPTFADSGELAPAKQVWFSDRRYGYFAESATIPTLIAMGFEPGGNSATIKHLGLNDLEPGYRCIFRHGAEGDVVRLFAEEVIGTSEYRTLHDCASAWRVALRSIAESCLRNGETDQGASLDVPAILRRFKQSGPAPTHQTMRNWLYDLQMIGPGDKSWLHRIATVSGDQSFGERVDDVWSAVEMLRSAHISAGHRLSAALISELPAAMLATRRYSGLFTMTFGDLDVVEVQEVDSENQMVPVLILNRMLGDGA